MWLVLPGIALLALGLAGFAFAPAMIEAQREEGMEPIQSGEIDESDRILVTRAMGAVFAVVGLFLVAYALSG